MTNFGCNSNSRGGQNARDLPYTFGQAGISNTNDIDSYYNWSRIDMLHSLHKAKSYWKTKNLDFAENAISKCVNGKTACLFISPSEVKAFTEKLSKNILKFIFY